MEKCNDGEWIDMCRYMCRCVYIDVEYFPTFILEFHSYSIPSLLAFRNRLNIIIIIYIIYILIID